jgi:hypothetical protein
MPRGQIRSRIRKRNYRAARRDRKEKQFMFGKSKKMRFPIVKLPIKATVKKVAIKAEN